MQPTPLVFGGMRLGVVAKSWLDKTNPGSEFPYPCVDRHVPGDLLFEVLDDFEAWCLDVRQCWNVPVQDNAKQVYDGGDGANVQDVQNDAREVGT